ncbi:MAG: hypothetical protein HXX15_13055 [Rhodopseudomonas sp.]|uniref:hypothetical protein n=1 Tax=Rhodopseudomonas sp. TaxID=1078 RepID=UPI0017EA2C65|nr:hypothetical protein [Rhodopseudomonas sp.]NVN87002.1 hypothetical protein [Rhodopseudomonas sp.]
MTRRLILLAAMAAISGFPAFAADGAWKFVVDDREHPILTYSVGDRDVFFVGCGHAFAINANYPGAQDRKGAASITISSAQSSMTLKGEIEEPEAGETGPARFAQQDLGYRRQDPELYEKAWHKLEDKLFNLLDSGKPLTISAEGKSYVLPPVDAPNWKARFKKIC